MINSYTDLITVSLKTLTQVNAEASLGGVPLPPSTSPTSAEL